MGGARRPAIMGGGGRGPGPSSERLWQSSHLCCVRKRQHPCFTWECSQFPPFFSTSLAWMRMCQPACEVGVGGRRGAQTIPGAVVAVIAPIVRARHRTYCARAHVCVWDTRNRVSSGSERVGGPSHCHVASKHPPPPVLTRTEPFRTAHNACCQCNSYIQAMQLGVQHPQI